MSLENNVTYTLVVTVAMDSGLSAKASLEFTVQWTVDEYVPDAEIGIDKDSLSAYIRPYCEDDNGNLAPGVVLSVYRRDYDGGFTEIASGIINGGNTYITDPHPSLNLARYRIVATSVETGHVEFYDVPGYPVNEKGIVIQWDEAWTSFNTTTEDVLDQHPWAGSMLKLQYNVDISEANKPDVALVEYIGRKHPVTYYGTQRGKSATWNVTIPKSDAETLHALRRLADWMGDVYVREPSGSGFWANVTISFSKNHKETTIPVTINVTRVEGGV
jgi:hypothetical protein